MLETTRLILRPFIPADLAAFAAINADPAVMRYFPARYSEAQTAQMLETFAAKWQADGLAFSAIEHKRSGALLGMCGLNRPPLALPISPCTEIGWRLTLSAWGQGYASEAASAWLAWGFARGLPEVLAFAPVLNMASRAVMARIGMRPAPELAFEHPSIPEGHRLRPMAVCRATPRGAPAP